MFSTRPEYIPGKASGACLLTTLKDGIVIGGPAAGTGLEFWRPGPAGLLEPGLPPSSSEERCQAGVPPMAGGAFSIPMPQMRVCASETGCDCEQALMTYDAGHIESDLGDWVESG